MTPPPIHPRLPFHMRLLRRLLYVVARPAVFPASADELGLDPDKPVCYVLQYRHLSNLLLVAHETIRLGLPQAIAPLAVPDIDGGQSFFFLSRRPPRSVFDTAPDPTSPLMRQLVARVAAAPDIDIQLVPVNIFWGRAPGRQDSMLKAALAETWRHAGTLRQILGILFHGRHAVVRFSAPISMRELLAGSSDPARGERKLGRLLRVHFRRQRERAIGPDLSHRHMLARRLLDAPAIRQAIQLEAEQTKLPLAAVQITARKIILEIAADYSYPTIRALALFLEWLWTRLYDGIELHGIQRVTGIDAGHGIVYVPCHRSHVDYLLLSFILYKQGLVPPHIAAGANLNLPLVGPLLRRGGAFFLRRSFKGDALYASLFNAYLQSILERGVPVEYFIEGGRSRHGRTLAPKAGILGMTLQGHASHPVRPLVFIPVYIGYEKLMEGRTYLNELAGQGKRAESLSGILATARRLRREFGRVHVNFGEPVSADALLDAALPTWREVAQASPRSLRPAIDQAAYALAERINAAAVLNPINLFALAMPGSAPHQETAATLRQRIADLQAIHAGSDYPGVTVGNAGPADAAIERAMHLGFAQNIGGNIHADDEQGALLAYFRNNVLHLFALPAAIAILLAHHRELPDARLEKAIGELYTLLKSELFLPWESEDLPAATAAAAGALAERYLIQRTADGTGWRTTDDGDMLDHLAALLYPLLERHYPTLAPDIRDAIGRTAARLAERLPADTGEAGNRPL